MRFLLPGVAASALLALTHLILWRLHRPRAEYAALVALAAVVLTATLSVFAMLQPAIATRPLDMLTALVLYASFFAAYITTYSAVQADSPTMAMLLCIADSGQLGVTRAELLAVFDDDVLVMPRLSDLVGGGFVQEDAGRYRIVSRGRALVRPQLALRRLLGMEKGG